MQHSSDAVWSFSVGNFVGSRWKGRITTRSQYFAAGRCFVAWRNNAVRAKKDTTVAYTTRSSLFLLNKLQTRAQLHLSEPTRLWLAVLSRNGTTPLLYARKNGHRLQFLFLLAFRLFPAFLSDPCYLWILSVRTGKPTKVRGINMKKQVASLNESPFNFFTIRFLSRYGTKIGADFGPLVR